MRQRSQIKFPHPRSIPRDLQPWRVAELCKAYNFPTSLPGGAVIGILEPGGGYVQSDLDLFSANNNLPMIAVEDVVLPGSPGNSPGGDADGEVALDIQVVAASYFYCTGVMPTIKMLWVRNGDQAFVDGISAAVTAGCDVLSISWGADENQWGQSDADAVEAAAAAATAAGMAIFAAAGDNSSSDGNPGSNVDLPSGCIHVIGCGGTTKESDSETVWGCGDPNGNGTGGGYSVDFPAQVWQLNAMTGPGRMVPDVAANADPDSGYLVVIGGQEQPVGGTSAVAPLYAGLIAACGKKLGFITPKLWQNPQAFTLITQGSNGSYSAGHAPSPCTGLGVPVGTNILGIFRQSANTSA